MRRAPVPFLPPRRPGHGAAGGLHPGARHLLSVPFDYRQEPRHALLSVTKGSAVSKPTVRHDTLTSRPAPGVYMMHAQVPGYITNLVVRSAVDPATEVAAIRAAIQRVDRAQAISNVKTMSEYVGQSLARPRLYAVLVTGFSVLALLLAVLGVYGLIAYVVSQRTHEIGIRMALGAGRGQRFRAVLRQALALAAAGLVVGAVAAAAGGRLFAGLLFGVTPADPETYVIATGIFVIAVLAAAAVPAWRAARVDPTRALRYE